MLFVVRRFHILISCETGQPSETKLDRNRPWKEEIFLVQIKLTLHVEGLKGNLGKSLKIARTSITNGTIFAVHHHWNTFRQWTKYSHDFFPLYISYETTFFKIIILNQLKANLARLFIV